MTICSPQLFTIFDEEFELDSLRDIVNHGMSAGVSGFIYYNDINRKYAEFKDEIMSYLNDFCEDNFNQSAHAYIAEQLSFDDPHWEEQDFIGHAVWMYVELKAHALLCIHDDEYWLLIIIQCCVIIIIQYCLIVIK